MTRVASPTPPYCASCFQQPDPEKRCVDFEAAYDGPVIPGTPEPVPVDDLIICESCLLEAFILLDPQNQRESIEELKQVILDQQKELDGKDRAIQGFRSTTNELAEFPVKTFPGKPKLEGVSPEVRKEITQARYKRTGKSPGRKQKVPAAETAA
jgi:hypothetical protein